MESCPHPFLPPHTGSVRSGGRGLVAVALFVLAAACQAAQGEVPIGGILPEATLQGLNGPPRKLSSFRGKPLVINVWASWCGPCRQEAASLERLAWSELGGGFNVIGISTDDYAENAQEWLQRSNATLNHFLDRQLQMEHMLGAAHLPLTVLVDAQGRVLDKIVGAQDWSSSEAAALLRRRFHLSRPPAGPSRTGWRSTPPAALHRTDLDQVSACRTPV